MTTGLAGTEHLEAVMGTVVGFRSPDPLPPDGVRAATALLHEADRLFSTWDEESPLSRLRRGELELGDLDPPAREAFEEVMAACRLAREMSDGAFDPWAMESGFDPTGLVKGWAAGGALGELSAAGSVTAMVNAGGDIATVRGPEAPAWRVGIRHPFQPDGLCAVVEVEGALATSGSYERPGELIVPSTGRTARGVVSASVTGPRLDLADALATALAVRGRPLLERIDRLEGYEGHLVTETGRHFATSKMAFAP